MGMHVWENGSWHSHKGWRVWHVCPVWKSMEMKRSALGSMECVCAHVQVTALSITCGRTRSLSIGKDMKCQGTGKPPVQSCFWASPWLSNILSRPEWMSPCTHLGDENNAVLELSIEWCPVILSDQAEFCSDVPIFGQTHKIYITIHIYYTHYMAAWSLKRQWCGNRVIESPQHSTFIGSECIF